MTHQYYTIFGKKIQMKHQYYTLLGDDRLFLIRWPTAVDPGEEEFSNGLGEFLEEQGINMDFFVTCEISLTDVPMAGIVASLDNLELAFDGDSATLPQFSLHDYRHGKFVRVVRPTTATTARLTHHPRVS